MIRRRRIGLGVLGVLSILSVVAATTTTVAAAKSGGHTRSVHRSGTAVFTATPLGSGALATREIRTQGAGGNINVATKAQPPLTVNRHHSEQGNGSVSSTASDQENGGNDSLITSFDGLNHRQQRRANGGNQFSLEPPDQGLCVGNGFVVETVNDVTRIYDTSGNPLAGVQDLNTFYGYAAQIDRLTGVVGPFVTDPSCSFDVATQRWFMDVLTLDTLPDGSFTGPNHIDLAVSQTSDPTQAWNIYRLPVQDDGTQGTPDHGCSGGADKNGNPIGHGPCLGDYPHQGADANGFYITTNEYSFIGPEFHGAQIYGFSKGALARGDSSVLVTQFDTHGLDNGNSGFTIWPATSPGGQSEGAARSGESSGEGSGTEYFLSSNAADEAHGAGFAVGPRKSNQLLTWALTNTQSLDSDSPDLTLSHTMNRVKLYATPPPSDQKEGSVPLIDCLNDTACATFFIGAPNPFFPEAEGPLDSNDTRMQQVTFVNGQLWGALDTKVKVHGVTKAGIEWFVVNPTIHNGSVSAHLERQGTFGLANNNVIYPAIGVTSSGLGVMAFTVVGANHFPSAGYATISADSGLGEIHVAAEGAGPQDGFTETKVFGPTPGIPRPRWGDYGAAVPVGDSVWIASEYIGQTCTFDEYTTAPFGSCGGTRTSLANWDTRISQVSVSQN